MIFLLLAQMRSDWVWADILQHGSYLVSQITFQFLVQLRGRDILMGHGVRSCKVLNVTHRLLFQLRGVMSWWGMGWYKSGISTHKWFSDSDILVGYELRWNIVPNITHQRLVQLRGRDVLVGYWVIVSEMTWQANGERRLIPLLINHQPSPWHDQRIIIDLVQRYSDGQPGVVLLVSALH